MLKQPGKQAEARESKSIARLPIAKSAGLTTLRESPMNRAHPTFWPDCVREGQRQRTRSILQWDCVGFHGSEALEGVATNELLGPARFGIL